MRAILRNIEGATSVACDRVADGLMSGYILEP